jgi:hypothetical protein
MRLALLLLMVLTGTVPLAADELPGAGPLVDAACMDCHADATSAWREGPHGAARDVGCVACHGERHDAAGSQARQSKSCIACHGGEKEAWGRSYATSKHGVIATLEGTRWDWTQRLAQANYRAPTCAYCHMHDGMHGQLLSPDVLETSCADCHSGRYVEALFAAGRRMLRIADLKLAEATAAAGSNPPQDVEQMLVHMKTKTLRNLRLGVGHQSPDYQWWYGHAALDGDLIGIKAAISRHARQP